MARSDAWGGLAWLIVGAIAAWLGHDLGLGTVNDPGSGAVVFWAGLLMALLSALTLVSGLRGSGAPIAELWAGTRWGRVLAVLAALGLYAAALGTAGFLLATPLLLLVLMRVVDPVRWTIAVPAAVGAPLLIWWVMEKALAIQLPAGLLEIG